MTIISEDPIKGTYTYDSRQNCCYIAEYARPKTDTVQTAVFSVFAIILILSCILIVKPGSLSPYMITALISAAGAVSFGIVSRIFERDMRSRAVRGRRIDLSGADREQIAEILNEAEHGLSELYTGLARIVNGFPALIIAFIIIAFLRGGDAAQSVCVCLVLAEIWLYSILVRQNKTRRKIRDTIAEYMESTP